MQKQPPSSQLEPLTTENTCVVSKRVQLQLEDVNVIYAVSKLKEGTNLTKSCRNHLVKPHSRFFWLDTGILAIRWKSPKKELSRSTVFLSEVRRVTPGSDSDHWRAKDVAALGIELVGSRGLHLLCDNAETWRIWMAGLLHAHQKALQMKIMTAQITCDYIRLRWQELDVNKTENMCLERIERFLVSLNIRADKQKLITLFSKYDSDSSGFVSYSDFRNLLCDVTLHRELSPLYKEYQDSDGLLSIKAYRRFLDEHQKMTSDEIQNEIAYVETLSNPFKENEKLTELGFHCLIAHERNSLMQPHKKEVYQNMNLPLSHYWIASSHNTYLVGDQVLGKSAVGQYIDVLLRGCRCVEIDCWDGSDGEPIVFHGFAGYAISQRLPFVTVIRACKDYGFVFSPYPLIISLEVHCSSPQKLRMGQILRQILGEQLLLQTDSTDLPSPNSCKHKVIVKGKCLKSIQSLVENDEGNEQDLALEEFDFVTRFPEAETGQSFTLPNEQVIDPQKLTKQYYSCLFLTARKFKTFDETRKSTEICSMNETRFSKLNKTSAAELVAFHSRNLNRVFPSGHRITSSNFSPCPSWCAGVQFVAMNWQALDIPTILNEIKFRENGGKAGGYILKPPHLLNQKTSFNGYFENRHGFECAIIVSVEVLGGYQLPLPQGACDGKMISMHKKKLLQGTTTRFDVYAKQLHTTRALDPTNPYVLIGLYGTKSDTVVYRTSTGAHECINPVWGGEIFKFEVRYPSLAILVFNVRHSDQTKGQFLCAGGCSISALRSGIRSVPVFDGNFDLCPSSGLLVRINIEQLPLADCTTSAAESEYGTPGVLKKRIVEPLKRSAKGAMEGAEFLGASAYGVMDKGYDQIKARIGKHMPT